MGFVRFHNRTQRKQIDFGHVIDLQLSAGTAATGCNVNELRGISREIISANAEYKIEQSENITSHLNQTHRHAMASHNSRETNLSPSSRLQFSQTPKEARCLGNAMWQKEGLVGSE